MIYLIQFLVAMISTISFAILFSSPKQELVFCGFTGGLGWLVYFLITEPAGLNNVFASLIATMVLTTFSRAFAVARQTPVTVYLLAGIFPLVPGAGIYYTAYYMFIKDTALFSAKALETLEIAGAIVFGIVFGFALPQGLFHKLFGKFQKH